MLLSEAELLRRRAAWDALSFLFLDTEVRDALPSAAVTLIEVGYHRNEIEAIFLDEITPVLHSNLKQVAGVWSGFDLDWLASEIGKRKLPDRPPTLSRWRRMVLRMRAWPATDELDALLTLVERAALVEPHERNAWARALGALVATYFERPSMSSFQNAHDERFIAAGVAPERVDRIVEDLYLVFPRLRVRGLDPAESIGRARVAALLAAGTARHDPV